MKEKFSVIAPGAFIVGDGIQIALEAFGDFYHSVTGKHQRVSELIIVDDGQQIPLLNKVINNMDLNKAASVIHWDNQEEIEQNFEKANLILIPSLKSHKGLIKDAFSYGIPVICFEEADTDEVVDSSCGIIIENEGLEQSIDAFSTKIKMMYFDPAARNLMCKKAKEKYSNDYEWQDKQIRANISA